MHARVGQGRTSIGSALLALVCGFTVVAGLRSPHSTSRTPPADITLGAPTQIFHYRQPDAMGMFNVPDMHTSLAQQPDKSYLVFITGNIGPAAGSVARLSTNDLLHYTNAGPGSATSAAPVLEPSCRQPRTATGGRGGKSHISRARGSSARETGPPIEQLQKCMRQYDADYAGANAVLAASNGRDLLMFYEGGTKTAGTTYIQHGWEFNVMALARSSDAGRTWTREGVVLSGTDPVPTARTQTGQPGISEGGVIAANGYLYAFFQYVPNDTSAGEPPSVIEAARAPLSSDGKPGSFRKYYNGSFSEPGLGGKASPVVATTNGACTRPVEVWPAYSTYLKAYVLSYLCNEGWSFSTSTDLVNWSQPRVFLKEKMWRSCKPMDWNFVLATPGNPAGVIGQTGVVIYAHTDVRGQQCGSRFDPHELFVRPFTFSGASTGG